MRISIYVPRLLEEDSWKTRPRLMAWLEIDTSTDLESWIDANIYICTMIFGGGRGLASWCGSRTPKWRDKRCCGSICETWPIHTCDTTHSYATWLLQMCDMTHSYVWHDVFIYGTCSQYDVPQTYVGHDQFACATWRIHTCDMAHSYVWHDSFTCDMTHS